MPETPGLDTSLSPTTPTTPTTLTNLTTTAAAAEEYISQEHPEWGRNPDLEEDEQASLLRRTGPTRESQYPQGNNSGPTVNGSGNSQSHAQRHHIMDNLFRFSLPTMPSSQTIRTAGVYVAGGLVLLPCDDSMVNM